MFIYNPRIWLYLIPAILLLFTFVFSLYKKIIDLWLLVQGMVMCWCLGFALQISCTSLQAASFWYLLADDAIGLKVPVVLLLWSLVVTGRRRLITWDRVILLFVFPLLTDIFVLTNDRHNLMYPHMWLDTGSGYPVLHYETGVWYWIVTVYSCILLFIIAALLINDTLNRKLLYPLQGLTLSVVTILVLLSIMVILVTENSLFDYYDPTPVILSMVVVGPTLAFRFRKQKPMPVPRNTVIDKMDSAVLILDNDNRIVDMNATAEAFLGLKMKAVFGQSIEKALPHWQELIKACARQKDCCEFSRDGRFYKAYVSSLSDERTFAGEVVIIQDVTEYKEIEDQTRRQQQALIALQERNRLARELHDSLGQVLGYVNMQIELIRKMLKTGLMDTIDNSLAALSRVVEEANTEVREFIYEVRTTLIFKEGFFAALGQYLQHFEQHFHIAVQVQNPDDISDEQIGLPIGIQLFRIIQEALSNVRKHARASKVQVAFRKEDQQIAVSISDNGVGFDPEEVQSKTSFGLSIMRERAGHIGGEVQIHSAPSQGTTVTIVFPLLPPSPVEPAVEEGQPVSGLPKIRVLLADDHVLFMEGVQRLIEQHNFEVVGTARDGYEALEKARALRPDMILMDLQMPRCNGITATRLIHEEMPEVKIVILSMSDREQDLFKAILNGASGYLLKGLNSEDFIDQLNGLASSNGTIISREIASQIMKEFQLSEHSERTEGTSPANDPLSQRQKDILSLIARGLTYKEVADKLYISERTVKYEMSSILKQLHLQNRSQAIAYARETGLIEVP